jgi:hypothetical protein
MNTVVASPFACLGDAPHFVVVGAILLVHDENRDGALMSFQPDFSRM